MAMLDQSLPATALQIPRRLSHTHIYGHTLRG